MTAKKLIGPKPITARRAIALAGSQAELARHLRLTRAAISAWKRDKPIPAIHEARIRWLIYPEMFEEIPAAHLLDRLLEEDLKKRAGD